MSKKFVKVIICLLVIIAGFICGLYISNLGVDKKKEIYVHTYDDYCRTSTYGDTILYKKIVEERMSRTPSHPNFLDLSIKMAGRFYYIPGYYNAYVAINDLYRNNNLEMGDNVKHLMYSYLQLAIENKDNRITKKDLSNYYNEFPEGISIR